MLGNLVRGWVALMLIVLPALLGALAMPQPTPEATGSLSGEALYERLRLLSRSDAGPEVFGNLAKTARGLSWEGSSRLSVAGHLRRVVTAEGAAAAELYLVRDLDGNMFVLAMPEAAESSGPYAGLQDKLSHKLQLELKTTSAVVSGETYPFATLVEAPQRSMLDRLFFIAIVLLLFLVMVGMGMTLTVRDFATVLTKPRGMIIGPILQFALLPLVAVFLGRLAGFHEQFPYIYLGLILIAASPGGVTSNLMTYLGKGDVALSVSLTAVCTVLSIGLTPLVITLCASNIPDFTIPVIEVVKTMMVLVLVPLFAGMLVRGRWEQFAKRAEKPFAILGIFALLFLIVSGIWSNADKFADTSRYGLKFYAIIFVLTLLGMVLAGVAAKIAGLHNFQARAVSLEVGLRNASLAMTIALLLQDRMGDFSSSMFFSAGIFGLWMYVAGGLAIAAFKWLLPLRADPAPATAAALPSGE